MSAGIRRVLFCWLALLLIAAIEAAGSFVHFDSHWRPLLLIPALGMVALVGLMFMRVGRGSDLARGFALAALFWLLLLLGLGTMDPMTRAVYSVPVHTEGEPRQG